MDLIVLLDKFSLLPHFILRNEVMELFIYIIYCLCCLIIPLLYYNQRTVLDDSSRLFVFNHGHIINLFIYDLLDGFDPFMH